MRTNGYISAIFSNGDSLVGERKSHAIVTVEPDFFVHEQNGVNGKYWPGTTNVFGEMEAHLSRRNPVRWFQRRDNSQEEWEIPNIQSIRRDSSLAQDASACEIQIINQKMKTNTGPRSGSAAKENDFGQPGYYTFNRGEHQNQRDRWRHTLTPWHRVLQPGALIRTYEGYGGHDKTLDECLVDGNLMQTGTWIVDDVTLTHDGNMTLKCRDMMVLMIDQLMYPPLMPDVCYPTQFYKNSETSFNYKDLSSIVLLMALWAGFWLKDSKMLPRIYGNIERTGFVPDSPIGADFFDKRTCMDVINEIKSIVGYISWVDQEGAFHFESPNYWEAGNFLYDGRHTDNVHVLDENTNLLSYSVSISKKSDRSDIYISSTNPELNIPGTKYIHHRWQPGLPGQSFGTYLRGMTSPMLVPVKIDMPQSKMSIMAQLIHLYLWFARRKGNATVQGNPLIDINDQVKIYERTTSESFNHYVRGISSNHDVTKGVWTMDLETSWLGTANEWAIVQTDKWNLDYANSDNQMGVSNDAYGPYREGKVVARRGAA